MQLLRIGILALALAGVAQAATPAELGLAKALKSKMQSVYRANGSDDVFTKVTCTIPSGSRTGKCKAYFTSKKFGVRGWFTVTASGGTGSSVRWKATAVTCRSLKTGKPVAC